MRISIEWLKSYVEVPAAVNLVERLTMAGLEVEATHDLGAAFNGVYAAKVEAIESHPNAERLALVTIDAGPTLGKRRIVCGAKNFAKGDVVPFATVGTTLPGASEPLRAANVRGIESPGMLCSPKELGLAKESDGLLLLPRETTPGETLARAIGREDTVLEIGVTPNRGDALSLLGIARELATLLDTPMRLPKVSLVEHGAAASSIATVRIDDADGCWRYAARIISGVTVGPSPQWLVRRLEAAGMRSINNVVDVTNYVMLEYGQPLHGFDCARLPARAINVRRARKGERLTALDGKELALDVDDLLICDGDTPLALAGVIGGASSEVVPETTTILLECATFDPASVRRSARRHGFKTEASYRFERGTSFSAVPEVVDRAAALIAELSGGTVNPGRIDVVPNNRPRRRVRLREGALRKLIGIDVPTATRAKILTALGFRKVGEDAGGVDWEVPDTRSDVTIEEDLVEEVARIHGYESVPRTMLKGMHREVPPDQDSWLHAAVRQALSEYDEIVSFAFVAERELAAIGAEAGAIRVANPLSEEQSVMRTSLVPSLVATVARAARHQARGIRLYESARTFRTWASPGADTPADEHRELVGVLWGYRQGERQWTDGGRVDFYDAKGAVERILSALRIHGASYEPLENSVFSPRAAASVRKGSELLGCVGELHPRAAKALDAPSGIYVFQLSLDALTRCAIRLPQAAPVQRFPMVERDLAVVVEENVTADSVRAVALEVGSPLLREVTVFDVYRGPQIGIGLKNLALALTYASPERTLKDEEVAELHSRIVAELATRLGGALRR